MPKKQISKFCFILLGEPGAGKATQAVYFAKKYQMFDLDMGKELTLLRERNKAVSQKLKNNYDKGNLAPTKMVRDLYKEKFQTLPLDQNILFDGAPKMLGEAKLVHGLLKKTKRHHVIFVYLSIPATEVVKRVLNRKGYTGTKFKERHMDTVEGLKNRARYYRKNIKEVVDFFSSKYKYKKISGLGTRTEVRARIQKAIDNYLKSINEKVH